MSFLVGTSPRTKGLRFVVRAMALAGGLAVAGIMLVTVADVAGRQVGHPVKGAYDWVRMLGAAGMVCALPLTKAVKGHIAIEYFYQKLRRRGRAATDTSMRLALLVLFGVLTWQFWRQGAAFREAGEVMPTLHVPVFWISWLAGAACLVTAGVTLWHLLHPGRAMMRARP